MADGIWKVVKIVDAYKLVINGGAEDGLTKKDELEVFNPGEPVLDPDTKEVLGTLDLIKSRIRIITVYPKMSLCENHERQVSQLSTAFASLAMSIDRGSLPLPVDATEISGGLKDASNTEHMKIRVGDLVRKALG